MYKPDRFFMKQLKQLDERLDCYYNNSIGKFLITYKRSTGQPVPIIRVETEDGGFRYPDRREINTLHESDNQRVSMRDRLDKNTKYMLEYRDKKDKEARDNLRFMTLDDKLQLRSSLGRLAGPKVDQSIFRKVTPKARGRVFG